MKSRGNSQTPQEIMESTMGVQSPSTVATLSQNHLKQPGVANTVHWVN